MGTLVVLNNTIYIASCVNNNHTHEQSFLFKGDRFLTKSANYLRILSFINFDSKIFLQLILIPYEMPGP